MLIDCGVARFSCPAFSLEFSHAATELAVKEASVEEAHALKIKDQWHHPALWGSQGRPPSFPGKDK